MLFPKPLHERIADGSVTVAFRRWRRPTVRSGGTLRGPYGVIAIDELSPITPEDITDEDAWRAGATDRNEVLRRLAKREGELYRIAFHHVGDDPRLQLREQLPADDDLAALLAALDDMDARRRSGPWTRTVLRIIDDQPEVLAGDLAEQLGRERLSFKRDVRRLKELGLTVSHPVGYRLSPRGRAVLDAST